MVHSRSKRNQHNSPPNILEMAIMITLIEALKKSQGRGALVYALAGTTILMTIMNKLVTLEGYSFFAVVAFFVALVCLWALALGGEKERNCESVEPKKEHT